MSTLTRSDVGTVRVRVDFGPGIAAELAPEIHRRIYYLSDDIVDFSLVLTGAAVAGVDIVVRAGAATPALLDWIRTSIIEAVRGIRPFKPRRVWDNDGPCREQADALFAELVRDKLIHVHGEGQVSIRAELVTLFQFFDALFAAASRTLFHAESYQFPTLLKTSVLADGGYFEKFPHLLMFVTRMKNDRQAFEEFRTVRDRCQPEQPVGNLHDVTCETGYSAPPTMCYFVYDMFRGQELARDSAVTAVGKSFRYENKYHHPLTRLWDFTIRETVFLGTEDYVRAAVGAYRRVATSLMERLGLKGVCESANDPFFLTEQTSALVNTQLLLGAKHELRLRVGPDATIAAASFNLHGQYFAKRFDLRAPGGAGEHVFSGCIGIGLERMVFAFLLQFGTDVARWPAIVREDVDASHERLRQWERLLDADLVKGIALPAPLV